ncbi:MAG: hypothetical protein AAF409_16825 [Pseudomonadota bacterium]
MGNTTKIKAAADRLEGAIAAQVQTATDIANARAEPDAAKANRNALASAPMAIDVGWIDTTRAKREAVWGRQFGSLDADPAQAFETAMGSDERARANYCAGTEARQRLLFAKETLARAQLKFWREQEAEHWFKADHEMLEEQRRTLARRFGLDPVTPLATFLEQLMSLEAAAKVAVSDTSARKKANARAEERNHLQMVLTQAAQTAGVYRSDDTLLADIGRALHLEETARKAWEDWTSAGQKVDGCAACPPGCARRLSRRRAAQRPQPEDVGCNRSVA